MNKLIYLISLLALSGCSYYDDQYYGGYYYDGNNCYYKDYDLDDQPRCDDQDREES